MSYIGVISWKELKSYLTSPMAYVVSAVFLAISGFSFVAYLAGTNYADTSLRGFVEAGQYLVLVFAALLTMRLVAEERRSGTWELMLTVPVTETQIVLGKFLGSLALLVGMLFLTLYYPFLLVVFGDPDVGPIVSGYLGLLLLGSAALSVGVFASSLTSSQLVSAVVAGGVLFGLWFLGPAGAYAPEGVAGLLADISLSSHFPGFARGVIDTQAVVYYLSVTALFLFLAVRSVQADRWR